MCWLKIGGVSLDFFPHFVVLASSSKLSNLELYLTLLFYILINHQFQKNHFPFFCYSSLCYCDKFSYSGCKSLSLFNYSPYPHSIISSISREKLRPMGFDLFSDYLSPELLTAFKLGHLTIYTADRDCPLIILVSLPFGRSLLLSKLRNFQNGFSAFAVACISYKTSLFKSFLSSVGMSSWYPC